MKTLKTRMISALGAAAMILSVPIVSMATWAQPSYQDVNYAVKSITVEATKLLTLGSIDENKIKVINIEEILTGGQLASVKNTLNKLTVQLQLVTLRNTLNDVDVLNDSNILTFGDVLSNNDVDFDDVVGTDLFSDGNLLVFCCKTCQ